MQHYLECKDVRFQDLDVINHANYNSDGMDINNCKDVILQGFRISGGDDAICLKSTSYSYSENITISDCILRSHCNTFKIGTETHGAIKNVVLSNCVMGAAEHKKLDGFWDVGISGISLQSNDGAVVENITITNVTIDSMMAPFFIRLQDRGRKVEESQEDPPVGTLRNIRIANVTATNMTAMASSITGVPGYYPENIEFENVSIHTVGGGTKEEVNTEVPELNGSYPDAYMFKTDLPGYGFFIRHVKNITFKNISITVGSDDARHGMVLEDVRDGYFSELFLNGKNSQFSAIKKTGLKNVIFNDIFFKGHPSKMNE
jgi:hypothetical protein